MPQCSLDAISTYCPPAVASLRFVTLYVPEQVAVTPAWGCGVSSAQEPEMKDGYAPITIPFDKFSAYIQSRPDTGSQGGDFWQHTVGLDLRRNRPEVGLWMRRMRNRRFHLVTQDWYGIRMWWPMMRLASARDHEAEKGGVNGFRFAFSRRWSHPGVYLANGTDPGTLEVVFTEEAWTGEGEEWTGEGEGWFGADNG